MRSPIIAAVLTLPLLTQLLPAEQDGLDTATAIPVYFGQVIEDTIDSRTRANQVYSITLSRGQDLEVTATLPTGTVRSIFLTLLAPNTPALSRWQSFLLVADNACCTTNSRTIKYTVSSAGTYFIWMTSSDTNSAKYTLRIRAAGTPIAVPNPPQAGCLTGSVDSVTYSLQRVALGLPDEVSIGGVKACSSCQVKAPQYPELASRIENALRSKTNVEACYDSAGNIFQLKLVQP